MDSFGWSNWFFGLKCAAATYPSRGG